MKIYLYKKTHNKTGLQYLGKTIQDDPNTYSGSGTRWLRHIKKHGLDIKTEILGEFEDMESFKNAGIYYSKLWNIVSDKKWANIIEESGQGISSEDATRLNLNRVKNGTHHLLMRDDGTSISSDLVESGRHHFLTREDGTSVASDLVDSGNHNFSTREDGSNFTSDLTELGLNPWQKRSDGTSIASDRVAAGTHHFVGDNSTNKRQWVCEDCGKIGKGTGNLIRWHENGKCLIK